MTRREGPARRARGAGGPVQDAAAYGGRQRVECGDPQAPLPVRAVGHGGVRPGVERVGIVAQLGGGAGESGAHPVVAGSAERGLQGRQQPPDADPGVGPVGVVRILLRDQTGGDARRPQRRSVHVEQRAPEAPAPRRHAGERTGAGAARQAQQHGLRLVVAAVPEQHRRGAQPLPGLLQRGVAGGPGSRLRPTGTTHAHGGDLHRRESQAGQGGGDPRGPGRRPRLEVVVDGDGTGAQPGARRLEGGRGGQGRRVSPSAAGHQHELARGQVGQRPADGTAHRGDCGRRPHRLLRRVSRGVVVPGAAPRRGRPTRPGR